MDQSQRNSNQICHHPQPGGYTQTSQLGEGGEGREGGEGGEGARGGQTVVTNAHRLEFSEHRQIIIPGPYNAIWGHTLGKVPGGILPPPPPPLSMFFKPSQYAYNMAAT